MIHPAIHPTIRAQWTIGIHEMYATAFDARMRTFCSPSEFRAAPIKKFARTMVKSFKYLEEQGLEGFEQQVLAPLYVIDVLRCSIELHTAQRLLEVRDAITRVTPVARIKNGFSRKVEAPCGYRDMKLR